MAGLKDSCQFSVLIVINISFHSGTECFQVSSDIWRLCSAPGEEPVVLFKSGAVRLLDSLLSAPQQSIEEVVSPEETIWSVFSLRFKKSAIRYLQKCH